MPTAMWVAVLLAPGAIALLSGPVSRDLPPAVATWLLSAASVLCALASAFVLAVLAATPLAAWRPVAALGRWSSAVLQALAPTSVAVSALCLLALAGGALLLIRSACRTGREWLAAHRFCAAAGPGQLLVHEDVPAGAVAVPGLRGGRIVASRQLLAALPPDERRALLAHEAAHLHYHHAVHRTVVELSAALNPLLRPVVPAARFATERWADDAAASVAGNRSTARALLHAALDPGRGLAPSATSAFSRDAVPQRVEALLAEQPRVRFLAGGLMLTATVIAVLGTASTARHTEVTFEQAAARHHAEATAQPAEDHATGEDTLIAVRPPGQR